MKLEAWCLVTIQGVPHLAGKVYGFTKCEDGTFIRTAPLIGLKDDKVVDYFGRKYELGEPESSWEKAFPDSKQRLLKSLEELKIVDLLA